MSEKSGQSPSIPDLNPRGQIFSSVPLEASSRRCSVRQAERQNPRGQIFSSVPLEASSRRCSVRQAEHQNPRGQIFSSVPLEASSRRCSVRQAERQNPRGQIFSSVPSKEAADADRKVTCQVASLADVVTEFVHGVDEGAEMVRVDRRVDAVAEIENMPRMVTKTGDYILYAGAD